MKTIKGPAIFLAQFAGDKAPFDTLDHICKWAADLGYKGVQIPTWVSAFIDVEKAATSKAYADDLKIIVDTVANSNEVVQNEINKIAAWADDNGTPLSVPKCSVMHCGPRQPNYV